MGTCYGLCIRLFSLLATAVALLLFQFGLDDRHKGSYSKVDVDVTYVLSGFFFFFIFKKNQNFKNICPF